MFILGLILGIVLASIIIGVLIIRTIYKFWNM